MLAGASIAERLELVRERVERAGRDPEQVAIIAVTKGRSMAACREALAAGLRALGENRVQEALPKLDELPEAEWHLVGHLQRNKVRHAAGRFALIQSVDSLALAEEIAGRAPRQPVLLQVNVAREPQKHGCPPEEAVTLAAAVSGVLPLRGLMCIGPTHAEPAPAFRELRQLRDSAEQRVGAQLPVLSMGMTEDFEAALAAGSTMLRLGRLLFGPR
jgi:pyridoxal phosphate enzyme (YggS family)